MNLLFVCPYYNNSHFIKIQIYSLRKYLINCNWKLLIIDDSKDNTINLITNKKENIFEECIKFPDEIIYHKFLQNLHSSNNTTIRHCTILNYIIQKLSVNYKNDFDYLVLFDADMCFINIFDPIIEISNYDIIGPKRTQWLSNIQISESPIFHFFWVHCCFFNLKTITNIQEINFNQIPNTTTDTGSMMLEFLYNNPQYKLKYLNFSSGNEYIKELNYFEFFHNNNIIHFGSSSLWNIDNSKYINYNYSEIVDKFFNLIKNGLTNSDKLIIKKNYEEIWFPKHKLFIGKLYTIDDLKQYGFNLK
jgi:hypothetical protein